MSDFKEQIWVVMPALNEAATIDAVVRDCLLYSAVVLVVDSGSTDGTAEIARVAGARVELCLEAGRGRALQRALELVEAPVTVFVGADGSHQASNIPRLAAPIIEGDAEMTVGSRQADDTNGTPDNVNREPRRAGSRVLRTLINWRWRADLTDIQNDFRALDTRIGQRIGLRQPDSTADQEMILKFLAGGFRVINVPSHQAAPLASSAQTNVSRAGFRSGMVALAHLLNFERPRLRAHKDADKRDADQRDARK